MTGSPGVRAPGARAGLPAKRGRRPAEAGVPGRGTGASGQGFGARHVSLALGALLSNVVSATIFVNSSLQEASPHMGRDTPYHYLWRLLDPRVFATEEAFRRFPTEARDRHFIRRTKEEMVGLDGTPLYRRRTCDTFSYALSPGPDGEQALYRPRPGASACGRRPPRTPSTTSRRGWSTTAGPRCAPSCRSGAAGSAQASICAPRSWPAAVRSWRPAPAMPPGRASARPLAARGLGPRRAGHYRAGGKRIGRTQAAGIHPDPRSDPRRCLHSAFREARLWGRVVTDARGAFSAIGSATPCGLLQVPGIAS